MQNWTFLKSRHFLDNLDQPTATCLCQPLYSSAKKSWHYLNYESADEIDKNLADSMVETVNNQWFRELASDYWRITMQDNQRNYSEMPDWWLDREVFNHANDEPCSCAFDYIDSRFEDPVFKMNLTMTQILRGRPSYCTDKMTDIECYYYLRRSDSFDLSIESYAKDGCIPCYSIGPNLWPLSEDKLIKTLTRSRGDMNLPAYMSYCTPKQGYHKSRQFEIYRCQQAEGVAGIMAFTEANGDTDYECGFRGSTNTLSIMSFVNASRRVHMNPIILVS